MSIHRFFTRDVIVRRERELGSNKRGLQATATAEGYYNEVDARERNLLNIVTERAWYFWFPVDQDIKEGDILENEDGKKFTVVEVTKHNIGINEHLQVLTTEFNA